MITIQRLNMDNSWVVNLDGTKILIDPWLIGVEVDFFPWFNKQWHRTKPLEMEKLPEYDFVLITQKYPDHFHRETLEKLQPKKLIVPQSIERKCKKLLTKAEVSNFNNDLVNCFGSNVNIHFLPTSRKLDPIYDALIIENGKHSIFMATHGYSLKNKHLDMIEQFKPYDLLVTPFNLYELPNILGGNVSLGIDSVRNLNEKLHPKYIVATHDEDKHATGLISNIAKITRAPSKETLQSSDYFGKNYLHLDHYNLVSL